MNIILQAIKALFRKLSNAIEELTQKINSLPQPKQADWEQNDTSQMDYVKNRPFYTEYGISTLWVPEQTITIDEYGNGYMVPNPDAYPPYELLGSECTVIFDGISYTSTFYEDFDVCLRSDFTTANGENIIISEGSYLRAPSSWAGEHTISISYALTTYHTLDDKYLSEEARNAIEAVKNKDYVCSINGRQGSLELDDIGAMSKNNPTASGSFSMGRKGGTTIGYKSFAMGYDVVASGQYSVGIGRGVESESDDQFVQGKFNIADTAKRYAHIIGNGSSKTNRSNIHTLDWNGNAWYQGDVFVGGTSQDNAERLLKESDRTHCDEYRDTTTMFYFHDEVEASIGGKTYYQVSKTVLPIDEFIGAKLEWVRADYLSGTPMKTTIKETFVTDYGTYYECVFSIRVNSGTYYIYMIIVLEDTVIDGTNVSAGIWSSERPDTPVFRVNSLSYTAHILMKLDSKYLDDDIARITDDGKALLIASSTIGSTKQFKITVDDNGTITATEV